LGTIKSHTYIFISNATFGLNLHSKTTIAPFLPLWKNGQSW